MVKFYYIASAFLLLILFSQKSYAHFIENKGQITNQYNEVNNDVLFIHQQPGLKVLLTRSGFSYELANCQMSYEEMSKLIRDEYSNPTFNIQSHRIDFTFDQEPKTIITSSPEQEKHNYYGHQMSLEGVRQFKKITYFNIQEGVDIEFLVNSEGQFKYNIIAHDFQSAQNLSIMITGSDQLSLENNQLRIHTTLGVLNEEIPMSYINKNGELREADVFFQLESNRLSFNTPLFSEDEYLIIDPQPEGVWGSYYGGAEYDITTEVITDNAGNVFHTGITMSSNIATNGAYEVTYQGGLDGYLVKYDTEGNLLWSSYYGGDQTDRPYALATDELGNIYLGGATFSEFGIATVGNHQFIIEGTDDIFIVKFTVDGLREWATYIGGVGHDFVTSMKHKDNKLYLTGHTTSGSGISTAGTFLPSYTAVETAYLLCIDDLGMNLLWGTYIGADMNSSGEDLEVIDDFLYVAGRTSANSGISSLGAHQLNKEGFGNGFLQKFNNDGTLVWGTYYGGQFTDRVYGTALDNEGNIYIAGEASSTMNISTPGAYQETRLSSEQGFLAKFNPDGVRQWGTYLGGTSSDYVTSLDSYDSLLVACGKTLSTSNISSTGAYQEVLSGDFDGFLNGFNTSGEYLWGSYFGGDMAENIAAIDIGPNGNIFFVGDVSGSTTGISFGNSAQPLFGGAVSDGFIVKFCLALPIGISYSEGFLIASGADDYEWFLNGVSLGVFNDSIFPTVDGNYSVNTSSAGNCVLNSDEYIHSTVNLEENALSNSTILYPNPISSSKLLNIETAQLIKNISIFDTQGKEVFKSTLVDLKTKTTLAIKNLESGVYLIKILTETGYTENKLIVY